MALARHMVGDNASGRQGPMVKACRLGTNFRSSSRRGPLPARAYKDSMDGARAR